MVGTCCLRGRRCAGRAFWPTLVLILLTIFLAERAFTFGTSFGFGRGFANVLLRAALFGNRVLVIVFAIDYPR